ncbi:MAG: hypothetical protein PHV09_04985 [Bacteroidales bacterium]|nr:hypothetical protein [Bacteroidales bacterium]MDD2280646.1 hypothetical protein [Bacteroidales bacterium]MDD4292643.1 hypothetical protein [Bacteroidales bacterium]MDD4491861.1 hypothetical protein [Bacteroidales bacterium]
MKNILTIKILFVFILTLASCGTKRSNTNFSAVQKIDSVKIISVNKELNPSFYLKIFGIYPSPTWYDGSTKSDKIFRLILYNNEEHISIVIETISIGEEGGSLSLVKQTNLTEEMLNLPKYSINKVEFKKWINCKKAMVSINNDSRILNMDSLLVYNYNTPEN